MTLTELAERVERLTGPCRETDALIVVALNLRPAWLKKSGGSLWLDMSDADLVSVRFTDDGMKRSRGNPPIGDFPEFTKSFDAAMTLLPVLTEMERPLSIKLTVSESGNLYLASLSNWKWGNLDSPQCKTWPIALSSVLLRARAASESSHG